MQAPEVTDTASPRRKSSTVVRDFLGRPSGQFLVVTLVVAFVYVLTRVPHNPYNHYVLLAQSFLDGRLDIPDPAPWLEVARIHGKAYVINPPAPVIFLLPFVAIWGTSIDHVPASIAVGALGAGVFWLAASRLWTDVRFRIAMVVLLVFGTNLWWAASNGGMWLYAHACAVLFSCLALWEALGRRRGWLVGLFLGLAGLSRIPVFATAPLYIYLVADKRLRPDRETLRKLAPFFATFGSAVVLLLAYNQVRYGTIGDAGYASDMYREFSWFRRGTFNPIHSVRHIYSIFFEPPVVSEEWPFFRPSKIGMSLILQTPAYLYAFRAQLRGRVAAAAVALATGAIPILTYWATGWSQFGYRFALDLAMPLMILTAAGMREKLDRGKIAVIAVCVLVNLWGTLSFNRLGWAA